MKISWKNDTDYHLRPLGALVRLAARELGWSRNLKVEVYYSSQGLYEAPDGVLRALRPYGLMGWAYVGYPHMALGLPNTYRVHGRGKGGARQPVDARRIPGRWVAAIAWHELGHCQGLRHPEMSDEMLHVLTRPTDRFAAADEIQLTRACFPSSSR